MNSGQVDYNPSVRYLKRIGPVTGERLENKGIRNLLDLLCYLPTHYVDPAWLTPLERLNPNELEAGHRVSVVGRVHHASECFSTERGATWFELHLGDNKIIAAKWHTYSLKELEAYVRIGGFAIVTGQYDGEAINEGVVMPLASPSPWPIPKRDCLIYPVLEGFSYDYMRKMIGSVVARYKQRIDFCLDPSTFHDQKLPLPSTAFEMLHLDWPCEHIDALNNHDSTAHQTVRILRQQLQLNNASQ